ncbi:MAG: alanine racemase [Candidatus Eisenbacteria bacterium]|uniref:Alanine racemase n=1 Tax=Eiseniibacteriota bacterium TaxID=2212470 RepID=A0A948RUN7_UNCEI|nr:alanine racemase [Candidatus Eisenbacteria bacterium]MBU1948061.1 alanine racemase [Candidatus Eisenbacteria bacterium]MBU2689878.1 alanine racemase [Candidatus Eisenbacteria bacterium]
MHYSSYVEISRSSYNRNVKFLRKLLGPGVRFSSVIKGNAYGHDIATFLPLAETCGVDHFSVFSAEEALVADQCRGEKTELLILGYIDNAELEWAIDRRIAFYVPDFNRLKAAEAAARKVNKPARIHLELETGMNRTGMEGEELERAAGFCLSNPGCLLVEGICTHLAGAESVANYLRIQTQFEVFNELCRDLAARGLKGVIRHVACSAAALNYPETRLDLARIGIAQYGYWPNQETHMKYRILAEGEGRISKRGPLWGILRWCTRIMSLKDVKRGDFVGYGNAYQAMRDLRIAAIPVGYYHGFARNLSNLGNVLVRGRIAPVIGYVNMNMMMIDVTDCPGVEKDDEVVLIGRQNRHHITVRSFSDLSNYVNYEILVRIPATIPRVVVD